MVARDAKTVICAALAGTKSVASWLTGSSAMLSEAIRSVVDTGSQLPLLHGLRPSCRSAVARQEQRS